MTTTTKLKVISADDHLQELPDLWQKRVPAPLSDQAPRMVNLPDGTMVWRWAGNEAEFVGLDAQAGRSFERFKMSGVKWDEIRPGTYDAHERLKDMDLDGVDASVLFPNFARAFIGIYTIMPDLDAEVAHACIRAYNDHLSDLCRIAPDRLIGIGILPIDTVEAAVGEMKRISTLPGLRGALVGIDAPADLTWNDPSLEPLWQTANELNIPLCMHSGGRRNDGRADPTKGPGGMAAGIHWAPIRMGEALTTIVWSGVFDRYPKLRFISVESGIGWLGWWKERGDNVYRRHRHWTQTALKNPPGDYLGRNVAATFGEDVAGIRLRDFIGVDALMWAYDYPHTDSTFPHSQEILEKSFENVSAEDKHKIVCGNAARIYGLA